jgi:syntaxin 5
MAVSIQDRTDEFRSILAQVQRKQALSKTGAQRQSLLSAQQKADANGNPTKRQRSEFARNAAEIGRSISATMGKLERLAQLAKRKTLFDDRPVEINELTFVIKQDLSQLTGQIRQLQALTAKQHPTSKPGADQEGEHNHQVVDILNKKVQQVGVNFKDVLEVRTKNIQASRSRTEAFVSSAASHSHTSLDPSRTDSPLYQTPQRGRSPGFQTTSAAQQDLLSLDPSGSSALTRSGGQSDAQLLLMEEAQPQNEYIQQRGQAIESIESTINELGSIFGQLAQMVSEQGEQIQRIDANTEDVVDNVEGAQRELMKYWNRVQGNRWLVAKMFGVLMICKFAQIPLGKQFTDVPSFPALGAHCGIEIPQLVLIYKGTSASSTAFAKTGAILHQRGLDFSFHCLLSGPHRKTPPVCIRLIAHILLYCSTTSISLHVFFEVLGPDTVPTMHFNRHFPLSLEALLTRPHDHQMSHLIVYGCKFAQGRRTRRRDAATDGCGEGLSTSIPTSRCEANITQCTHACLGPHYTATVSK